MEVDNNITNDSKKSEAMPSNMTTTENSSPTFISTTSACLDFFFEVLQNSQKEQTIEALGKAWQEDALLTLKLIFQLRDIRKGKGAVIEFQHCLKWLFLYHPLTLNHNLKHISHHGYWKDLSWFVKFLLENEASTSTQRQNRNRNFYINSEELTNENYSLDELIQKRVDGTVSKRVWTKYLNDLPDERSKSEARKRFQELAKTIHSARSKEAKLKRKAFKAEAKSKLSNFSSTHQHFSTVYETIVNLFATALQHDKKTFTEKKSLPTSALAAKWAPTIGDSIDLHTSLGKNIARSLYRSDQVASSINSKLEFDQKAFVSYRIQYLTPLRTAIGVPERLMSRKKWSEIDYQRVPSVCMKRNKKNFKREDSERFDQYLEDVKCGKKKIASGALLPHQLVNELMSGEQSEQLESVVELQWNSYVENLRKSGHFESALSICDVSGSMNGIPMQVAIALSLLTAALSKPPFQSYICSFSEKPSLHKIDQPTLKEKVSYLMDMEWGMNTNMQVKNEFLNTKIFSC